MLPLVVDVVMNGRSAEETDQRYGGRPGPAAGSLGWRWSGAGER